VGERKRMRWLLILAYCLFGALSMLAVAAFFDDGVALLFRSRHWAIVHLFGAVPVMLISISLVLRHLLRETDREELIRTWMVLTALVAGITLAAGNLWNAVGIDVSDMVHHAIMFITILMAVVVFRYRLLEQNIPLLAVVLAVAMTMVSVLGYLASFRFLAPGTAILVFVVSAMLLVFMAMVRNRVKTQNDERTRVERLAFLGRLSAQMAHDIKNPLTALKGSIQFLQEERTQGRSIDDQQQFLTLMADEIDRLSRLVDKYRRLGKLEPDRSTTSINDLVRQAVSLMKFEDGSPVPIKTELDEELPRCDIDGDLVATAIQNLVQNAREAMSQSGEIEIRTELHGPDAGSKTLQVVVTDNGTGMNPRQLEQALDEFYTTKAHGSGLGLSFAGRVAEAHGGQLLVSSREGKGTVVRMCFPIA